MNGGPKIRICTLLPMALLLFFNSGCLGCTLVGCTGLVITLPEAELRQAQGSVSIQHCLDGVCEQKSYPAGADAPAIIMTSDTPDEDHVRVSVEAKDEGGIFARLDDTEVKLNTTYPNGRRCGPKCHNGDVRVPALRS